MDVKKSSMSRSVLRNAHVIERKKIERTERVVILIDVELHHRAEDTHNLRDRLGTHRPFKSTHKTGELQT